MRSGAARNRRILGKGIGRGWPLFAPSAPWLIAIGGTSLCLWSALIRLESNRDPPAYFVQFVVTKPAVTIQACKQTLYIVSKDDGSNAYLVSKTLPNPRLLIIVFEMLDNVSVPVSVHRTPGVTGRPLGPCIAAAKMRLQHHQQ
jgi:hypothetical protein